MHIQADANPFQMMLNPAVVLQAVERLEQATQLQRRICRPLDKPAAVPADESQAAFDRSIDGTLDRNGG